MIICVAATANNADIYFSIMHKPLNRIILVTTHHQGLLCTEHMAGLELGEVGSSW